MPIYGPHNLRWTAGPEGTDIIGSIGADPSIAEYPAEIFGTIMEDLMGNKGMSKSAREEIGGLYNKYRPGIDTLNTLRRFLDDKFTKSILNEAKLPMGEKVEPRLLQELSQYGMHQGMNLIEKLQELANYPEMSQLGNKIIPSFIRGSRKNAKR